MDGSEFTNQLNQENWVSLVAQRYSCYNADSIFLLELISELTTIHFPGDHSFGR